jgi:hypothetical protein
MEALHRAGYSRNLEHSPCTFPFTHGSSLAVNTALLIADSSGLVPFTDSQLHHNMLVAKFQRIIAPPSKSKPLISGIRQLHPEKLRRVALTLLNVMVPEEIIDNMSIADCIKYRDASAESFLRLKVFIGDLASQIESEPMTEKFEQDMQKLIHQKVIPEAQKVKDKGIRVYEKLFGKIGKRAAAMKANFSKSFLAFVGTMIYLFFLVPIFIIWIPYEILSASGHDIDVEAMGYFSMLVWCLLPWGLFQVGVATRQTERHDIALPHLVGTGAFEKPRLGRVPDRFAFRLVHQPLFG